MKTRNFSKQILLGTVFATCTWGCGGSTTAPVGTGGGPGTGGSNRTGGTTSTGGSTGAGGVSATGGGGSGARGGSGSGGGLGGGGSGPPVDARPSVDVPPGNDAWGGGAEARDSGNPADAGVTSDAQPPTDAAGDAVTVAPSSRAIVSGVPWYTTTGDVVNAHGAGIFQVGDAFYLVGEMRTTKNYPVGGDFETNFAGVSCYHSKNLVDWTYDGVALDVTSGSPLDGSNTAERPKVLFNKSTQKYVMFLHEWQNSGVALAESASPCADYKYIGDLTFNGSRLSSGDIGVFVDDDGSAYLLNTNGSYYRLATDFHTAASSGSTNVFGVSEAPALVKIGGVYFYLTSHATWWHSNDNIYATAASMAGPWTSRGTLAPSGTNTYNSQTTFLLAVKGSQTTTILYAGDRWCDTCLPSTTSVWQPLQVNGNALTLSAFHPVWSVDVGTGSFADVADVGSPINDTVIGASVGQIQYDASWTHSACAAGDTCFNGDNTRTNSANATASFRFSGTQARLYAVVDVTGGLLGISVCDAQGANCGVELPVTQYAPQRAGNQLVWTSRVLPSATYTVKLRNLGTKDNYSSNTYTTVDRWTVSNGTADF
jgi:hypothetical protein